MNIGALLQQLSARLPELEWKVSVLGESISSQSLPRGLFRYAFDYSPVACIAEIKADIHQLSLQDNQKSAYYLAERIRQKISVLVGLCNERSKKMPSEKKSFGVTMISTRQRWLQELEKQIDTLLEQRDALIRALDQAQGSGKTDAVLAMKRELGSLEQQLTMAKEKFDHAMN